MAKTAAVILRNYEIDGVPSSGAHVTVKKDLRDWGIYLEGLLNGGPSLSYNSFAGLLADLNHPANTLAMVHDDPTPANNGLYEKSGASGTGTWTRIGDTLRDIVRLTVTGGTGNAITATATEAPQAPTNKLYLMTPTANNSAGAVTINGTPLKDYFGNDPAANALINNSPVLMGFTASGNYQLLIAGPVDASGILASALAAQTAAAASATAAASSASALANQVRQFDTRAQAIAATIPVGVAAIKVTRYATGYPLSYATYVPGLVSDPGALLEAGGHYWKLDLTGGVVDPRWFGAKCDGVNDDTTAIQAALTAALGGKTLLIPASAGIGITASLDGGAGGVRVIGEGKSRGIIKALGSSTVDPMLKFTDAFNVEVRGVDFQGNSALVDIGAIQFLCTAGSNVIGNYVVQGNAFSNFKAHYWIRFLTNVASTSHTRRMRYIRVVDNEFQSNSGNDYDFTNVGQPSQMVATQGSIENNGSYVDDVLIARNFADCSGVKGFAACWASSRNVKISENIVLNAGSLGINDRGCYGVFAYNNHATGDMSYAPMDIAVTNNSILAARSIGFYGAQGIRLDVSHNTISGVIDNTAASLPYAAISFGQCEDSKANYNTLFGNYVGLYLIPTSTSPMIEAIGNRIESTVTNAKGILCTSVGNATNKVKIAGNIIILSDGGALGVSVLTAGALFGFDKVDIVNNRVSSGGTGIVCSDSTDGNMRGNKLYLQDNAIEGALATTALDLGNASTIKTIIHGGSINLANAGASAVGMLAPGHTKLNIDGLTIQDRATGSAFAFSAASANGTMRNVNLVGIARANLPADASNHMGFASPAGTPVGIGVFIQNLSTTFYTAQGSGGSQYTIDGWVTNGTSWLPRRCLTGT